MSQEITIGKPNGLAPAAPVSIMEIIAGIASNPAADVAKLERLLDLQERFEANQARVAFNRAMKDAQEEMDPVRRDAKNESNHSRYARLETIDSAIRPIYTRHGFSLSFTESQPQRHAENVRLQCNVHHVEGHTEPYYLEAPPDVMGPQGKATKTGVQGMGSTVSYLRRYLETMIFNIVLTNEDVDGQRPRNTAPPEPMPQAAPTPATNKPQGGKTFGHLKGFEELKKGFIAIGHEDEYRAGLARWGKQKSNQFGADEVSAAKDCWKYLRGQLGRVVETKPDPVPLGIGARIWFEGARWVVEETAEGFDWVKV